MARFEFSQYLPQFLHFLPSAINWFIFIMQTFLLLHVDLLFITDFFTVFGKAAGTLEVVTSLITMIIITSFSYFNVLFFQLTRKKYLKIVDFINQNFRRRSAMGVTCITTERTYLLAKRLAIYWTISCLVGTLQWVVVALFSEGRAHPLAVTYRVVDQKESPYYEIIFVMHSICQFLTGISFANANNVLFSLSFLICGQFDILFCSLKNLRNTAMVLNGKQLNNLK